MSEHTDLAAVLAELRGLRTEVAELRRELTEASSWVGEIHDHVLHVRLLLDEADL